MEVVYQVMISCIPALVSTIGIVGAVIKIKNIVSNLTSLNVTCKSLMQENAALKKTIREFIEKKDRVKRHDTEI